MNLLFGNRGDEFLDIIYKINKYCINSKFPSLKNTIDKFNFDDVYDEILNYIDSKWFPKVPQGPSGQMNKM